MKRFVERRKKPRLNKLVAAILLTVFSIILLFSAGFAFLIVSPLGGKLLVRSFKQEFSAIGLMHIGHYEGSLQDGFVFKEVSVKGLSYLPEAVLRIQEIRVHVPLGDLSHSDVGIFNARIFIPYSDPVVFTGELSAGQIKGNLYAQSLDLHEVSRFWTNEGIRKNLQGFISNVDVTIQGPLFTPKAKGSFQADSIRYKSVQLTNVFSKVDLTLYPVSRSFQMEGEVLLDSGLVNIRHTDLQLYQSKFIFKGTVFNPVLDIHLGSKVEDMEINLAVNGPLNNPQLVVSSDPPMSPKEALQVLFTGNAWSSSTSPFNGVTSGQLAENFLDYSLQDVNSAQQQIGFKTKLTDNLKLGAEMDQVPLPPGETNTYYSRKINGEMDLNDHMSLNVSQEVLPQDSYPSQTGGQDAQTPAETQIYVQYKKRF